MALVHHTAPTGLETCGLGDAAALSSCRAGLDPAHGEAAVSPFPALRLVRDGAVQPDCEQELLEHHRPADRDRQGDVSSWCSSAGLSSS